MSLTGVGRLPEQRSGLAVSGVFGSFSPDFPDELARFGMQFAPAP